MSRDNRYGRPTGKKLPIRLAGTRNGGLPHDVELHLRLAASAAALVLLCAPVAAVAQGQSAETARERSDVLEQAGAGEAAEPGIVIVTGSAIPVDRERIGNTLTVVKGAAVEIRHTAYLQDVLREVPGVAVSQGGSFGSLSQVRIRGAEGNHVLVLVDGIDVSAAGTGEFDFSSLLANAVDRVEVLRGPQSGLYGSNALAGVIDVISQGGEGPLFDAAAEYGTFDSMFGRAGVTLGDRQTFISANAVYRQTDGFSSAAIGTEADGDRNLTVYLRGGAKLADVARLDASLRHLDKNTETDGFDFSGGPLQGLAIDDDSYSNTNDWSGGINLTVEPVTGWQNILSAAYSHGDSAGGSAGTETFGGIGERLKLGARSSYRFDTPSFADATHTVTTFVEHEEERYRNTFPFDPSQESGQKRDMLGYGAEYRLDLADTVFLRAAIRHDDNDAFADPTTFSLAGSWVIPPSGTRLHASYGTGVTNPTFFEQFGFVPGQFVGNPGLRPEKAAGFDFGVEQRLFHDKALLDITYFRSVLEDEIVSAYPSVANDTGESDREGVELALRLELGQVSFGGSYTYLDAADPDGSEEVQRPKHQASADVSGHFGPGKRGSFSAGLIYNGEMLDTDFRNYFTNGFLAEKTPLDPYTVVRLSAAYGIAEGLELFGRLENALDQEYEQVISYAAPARAVYAGLRFTVP